MKHQKLSVRLKLAVIVLGLFGLLIYGAVLPCFGMSIVGNAPEMSYRFWPWMTLFLMTAVPCYMALIYGWKIATDIGADRSFSRENAMRMRHISQLAYGDVVLFLCGNLLLFFWGMSHPGVLLLSLLPDLLGIAVAVCASALSHLIDRSAELQQDADLTI